MGEGVPIKNILVPTKNILVPVWYNFPFYKIRGRVERGVYRPLTEKAVT